MILPWKEWKKWIPLCPNCKEEMDNVSAKGQQWETWECSCGGRRQFKLTEHEKPPHERRWFMGRASKPSVLAG